MPHIIVSDSWLRAEPTRTHTQDRKHLVTCSTFSSHLCSTAKALCLSACHTAVALYKVTGHTFTLRVSPLHLHRLLLLPLSEALVPACTVFLLQVRPHLPKALKKHYRESLLPSGLSSAALLLHLLMLQEMLNRLWRLRFHLSVHSFLFSSLPKEMHVICSFTRIHSPHLFILHSNPSQNVQSLLFHPHILLAPNYLVNA